MQQRTIVHSSPLVITRRALSGPRQLRQTFRLMAQAYGGDSVTVSAYRQYTTGVRQVDFHCPQARAIVLNDRSTHDDR